MNLTALFIRRPVMTALLMIGILIFGTVGYRALPVNDLPVIDFPTIMVMASLPGASPETMASSVAAPLEREFSTIAGLDNMTSSSQRSQTFLTLQFSLDREIDSAAADVQNSISSVARRLPPGMPNPPTTRKLNPADRPILQVSLNSTTLPIGAWSPKRLGASDSERRRSKPPRRRSNCDPMNHTLSASKGG